MTKGVRRGKSHSLYEEVFSIASMPTPNQSIRKTKTREREREKEAWERERERARRRRRTRHPREKLHVLTQVRA